MGTKAQLAWAAGLFEGEGCISVGGSRSRRGGRNRTYMLLSLKMTDEDVVRHFAEVVGHGRVNGPYSTKNKQAWTWYWMGDTAAVWAAKYLVPLLGQRRQARFADALEEVAESVSLADRPCLHKVRL